ncbi:MAG: hypothetical protein R3Y13_04200 [bacterium]
MKKCVQNETVCQSEPLVINRNSNGYLTILILFILLAIIIGGVAYF